MAFEIYNDSTQYAQFITLLILTPLGILVTALRFVAVRRVERKVGVEDWLAIIATLFAILTNLAALMAISILNGRSITEEVMESRSDYARMRKWDLAGLYFYFVQTLAVKLSVLALCYRIFSFNNPGGKICIYILGAMQTLLFTGMSIFQGFQCVPLAKYFDLFVPGHCTDEGTVILGGEIPNSIIDFAMVILAMVMIRSVQLSTKSKLRIMVIFGLGFIVGIIGFVKVAITYSVSELYAFSLVSIWTSAQMFASLLCCSLPTYNPFFMAATNFWRGYSQHSLFTWTSMRSSRTGKSSSKTRGDYDSDRHASYDQQTLVQSNGSDGLTWPSTLSQADGHALTNIPPQADGIHVQRTFNMV